MASITLRIRTQVGMWRLNDVRSSDTFGVLLSRVGAEHHTDISGRSFTRDASSSADAFLSTVTVGQAGLKHGDVIFLMVDEEKTGVHEAASASSKKITKSGDLISQDFADVSKHTGFRPGMMALKDMKKQWTLTEFISLDEQFVFRLKASEPSHCKLAYTDNPSIEEFFSFVRSHEFRKMRVGFLYGTFDDKENATKIDFIYEPPQENSDISFQLLEDPNAERVDRLAELLGMRKVGWIFAHPPREAKFHFSCAELLMTAEQQLEAAEGVEDSLFVTVKVTLDADGNALVDAWQVNKQCREMVAEGALEVSVNLGMCAVNKTFTAYVEHKPVPEVDNNFFLTRVPIKTYESRLTSRFPRMNRGGLIEQANLRQQLELVGKQGWTLRDVLGDMQVLLYLCNYMDLEDLSRICASVVDLDVPVGEGDELVIRSIAGMVM